MLTAIVIAAYIGLILFVVAICAFSGRNDCPKYLREDNE